MHSGTLPIDAPTLGRILNSVRARLLKKVSARKASTGNVFRVLIVYEDYPSGQRAMETYQRLLSEFGRDFDFRISIWSFGVLQCARLNEHAIHDAVGADAIILSGPLHRGLPVEIKRWIEGWALQKIGKEAVLIALLGAKSGQDEMMSTGSYLKEIAAKAEMDFLIEELQSPTNEAGTILSATQMGGYAAYEGWGLND